MGCCEATNPDLIGVPSYQEDASIAFDRRTALKGMLGFAGVMFVSACGPKPVGEATKVRLAFCGQLLCVVPYEVARARGHFADQGLEIELVYTRGGNAAMQALVGGAVEYAGTSFDVALQAVPTARRSAASLLPDGCLCTLLPLRRNGRMPSGP